MKNKIQSQNRDDESIRNRYARRRRSAKGGFTLIEIITVLVVLGIVVTLAVSQIGGTDEAAEAVDGQTLAAQMERTLNAAQAAGIDVDTTTVATVLTNLGTGVYTTTIAGETVDFVVPGADTAAAGDFTMAEANGAITVTYTP